MSDNLNLDFALRMCPTARPTSVRVDGDDLATNAVAVALGQAPDGSDAVFVAIHFHDQALVARLDAVGCRWLVNALRQCGDAMRCAALPPARPN